MKKEIEKNYLSLHLNNFKDSNIESYVDFYYSNIYKHVKINKDSVILDFGCGKGELMQALLNQGFNNLYGVDRSLESIEYCSKRGLAVFETLDNFKKESLKFDLIFLFDVVEHIELEECVELLKSLKGFLKESGYIIIKTPNASSIIGSYSRYNDLTHKLLYTENSILSLTLLAGLEIKYLTSIDPVTSYSKNIFIRIGKNFFLLFNFIVNSIVKLIYFTLAPFTIRHSKVHLLAICYKN